MIKVLESAFAQGTVSALHHGDIAAVGKLVGVAVLICGVGEFKVGVGEH